MKFIIVFVALFAIAIAAPADIEILRHETEVLPESYKFVVETSDGKKHEEAGNLKTIGDQQGIAVTGQFSYVGEDGVTYLVNYVADENGFQPHGDHLPH